MRFPERKPFFEHERAAIPDSLALERRDMTAKDPRGDTEQRNWIAQLHVDPYSRQETPVRFNEGAAG
jgi:hypothetical protein